MKSPFDCARCTGNALGWPFTSALVASTKEDTMILSMRRGLLCLLLAFVACLAAPPAIVSAQEGGASAIASEATAETRGIEDEDLEEGAAENEDLEEDGLEDDDIGLLEIEIPVVVTAARREQKITAVPYAMSIITAEDIRWSGARSIPDALRLAPGVDVANLTFGQHAVSPRGFHSQYANKTLVLVDGRQIYDSLFGGTLWETWPFQLEDVERIEVIRGPGGVTWGANAANGVINIITKDPRDQLGLTFTGGGESRGGNKEHLGYAFEEGKLRMRVSGEYEGSDGFKEGGIFLLAPHEDIYRRGSMGIHGVYEAGEKDTLTFSVGSSIMSGGFPIPALGALNTFRPRSQANYVLGKWSHTITDDNVFSLTGFFNDYHLAAGVPYADYRYQQYGLQYGHVYKPASEHTLSWGVDTRFDYTDATNADPFMLTEGIVRSLAFGMYFQDEWRFAPRWALNVGGRVDYDAYGGWEPSARGALSYEVGDNGLVYGAVSRAFNMAPSARRFMDFPIFEGVIRSQTVENLPAETLIAYELGYRGRHFERLDVGANLFWHEYSNLITADSGSGGAGLMRILSGAGEPAAATLGGVELDFRYHATRRLTLLGNYTYQCLDWHAHDGVVTDNNAMKPPEHKAMLGVRYSPTDDLHLSSHLYYVDATQFQVPGLPFLTQRIDPYLRLDLRGEYEFWDDTASVALGVRNLTDRTHMEGTSHSINMGEVPRTVFAEFRVTLK